MIRDENRETNDNSQMVTILSRQLFPCNDPIQTCLIYVLLRENIDKLMEIALIAERETINETEK